MIHKQIGLLLLIVLSTSSQRIARYYDDEVVRGDEFIDQLLVDMIHDHGDEYDPYVLEDSVIGFSKKIAFVNISGEAKLYNGYVLGLKSLHRPEHCSVHEEDDILTVKADLAAGVFDFHYDGTVKFMNWGPTISIFGRLSYVETHMEFSVDAKTGRDGELKEFDIDDMKGMEVWITGLGPLNWAANYLISSTASLFQAFIKNMLENQIRYHVAERLPNYIFPVDDSAEITETSAPEKTEKPETPEVKAFVEKILSEISKF